jgi:hypothetical protein
MDKNEIIQFIMVYVSLLIILFITLNGAFFLGVMLHEYVHVTDYKDNAKSLCLSLNLINRPNSTNIINSFMNQTIAKNEFPIAFVTHDSAEMDFDVIQTRREMSEKYATIFGNLFEGGLGFICGLLFFISLNAFNNE